MSRHYLVSMFAGWAFWLILIVAAYSVDASEQFIPKGARKADIPDTVATVLIVAAFPVKVGGWLFLWGDGSQPPEWVTGLPFNALIGLALYGTLGIIVGTIYGRRKHGRKVSDDSQALYRTP